MIRSVILSAAIALAACPLAARAQAPDAEGDPNLWLEEVTGNKALEWVRARNGETREALAGTAEFRSLENDIRKVLDSAARIPFVSKHGAYYYNFWKDGKNPRGLWRRTTPGEFRKSEPAWDVLIDLDALNDSEKENWVWKGAQILKAGGHRRALITLSRGGADAAVTREYDIAKREFVKDGFFIPEAKGSAAWIDENSIYVATDFGPGSMTASGYPRMVKRWRRGVPLEKAELVYEGLPMDMSVGAEYDDTEGFERGFVVRSLAFYRAEKFLVGKDGKLIRLDVPADSETGVAREWLTVQLRSSWTVESGTYPPGALLAARLDDFLAGKRRFEALYLPARNSSLASYAWTRNHLVLNTLEDVKNRLFVLTPGTPVWKREEFRGAPEFSAVSFRPADPESTDEYFMEAGGFLVPPALYLGRIGGERPEKLKEMPAFFDASGLEVAQHFARSKDGTLVPYFQVSPKAMKADGTNPTLLSGYGGFEISETPYYSGTVGLGWLAGGGVYALANIRGGGEYGPAWHQAALKWNRHRAYEDFAAVAADLIERKVTAPARLACRGGSNGGLLTGNMLTLYPQVFGAVVSEVPLLDMKRYSHLLAGASWMAEYGDPDRPEEWEFIRTFSPYHNIRKGAVYPPALFMTSTRDDRVHPGHARKMAARLLEEGHDVLYYENIEGGHAGAADNSQRAFMQALAYTFLKQKLR